MNNNHITSTNLCITTFCNAKDSKHTVCTFSILCHLLTVIPMICCETRSWWLSQVEVKKINVHRVSMGQSESNSYTPLLVLGADHVFDYYMQ